MAKYENKYDDVITKIYYHDISSARSNDHFRLNDYLTWKFSNENKVPFLQTGFSLNLISFADSRKEFADVKFNINEDNIECIKTPVTDKKEENLFRTPYVKFDEIKNEVTNIIDEDGNKTFYYGFFPNAVDYYLIFDKNFLSNYKTIGTFPVEFIKTNDNGEKIKYKYFLPVIEYNGKKYLYFESGNRKLAVNFEPLKWILDEKTGIAHPEKAIYYGTEDYLNDLDDILHMNFNKHQKNNNYKSDIQNIVDEIKKYAINYNGDVDVLDLVSKLICEYEKELAAVKENDKKGLLSNNSADGLYKALIVNLSNILDSIKYVSQDKNKYSDYLDSLDMKDDSIISNEIKYIKENVLKPLDNEDLDSEFANLIDEEKAKVIKKLEQLSGLSNNDDALKLQEDIFIIKIKEFIKKINTYKDYYDFIKVLRLKDENDPLGIILINTSRDVLPRIKNDKIKKQFNTLLISEIEMINHEINSKTPKSIIEIKKEFNEKFDIFLLSIYHHNKDIAKESINKTLSDEIKSLKLYIDYYANKYEKEQYEKICDSNLDNETLIKKLSYLKYAIDDRLSKENYYDDYNMKNISVK